MPVSFYALVETEPFPWAAFAAGVAAGPLIGVGVYYGSRWCYPAPTIARIVWATFTVFFAGVALLAAIGSQLLTGVLSGEAAVLLFIYSFAFPPAWLVYLLAYANHEWLRHLSGVGDDQETVPVAV